MRVSLEAATGWIDGAVARLGPETVERPDATGRILVADVVAARDVPRFDRAAADGLAVRAEETLGASAYNPLRFYRAPTGETLPTGGGAPVSAGDRLLPGSDAVVPLAFIEPDGTAGFDVIQGVTPGAGIERRGGHCARGQVLLKRGRRVLAYDLGLLALAGVGRLDVVRRPSVVCVVSQPEPAGASADGDFLDANGPLLRELVVRDGGAATVVHPLARDARTVSAALADRRADLVIIAGGTGDAANDVSAAAVSALGQVAIHGVALQPAETAGLGRLAIGTPVCLLPGTPAACLWAYEFLAGRAVRLLGGRAPALPFRVRGMVTIRKISSAIGITEIVPVRTTNDGRVEPVASFAEIGLAAVTVADGFLIVPEGSEGVPEGTKIDVHLYRGPMR